MLFQYPTIVTGRTQDGNKVLDQSLMALHVANELVAMNDNNRAIFIFNIRYERIHMGMEHHIYQYCSFHMSCISHKTDIIS